MEKTAVQSSFDVNIIGEKLSHYFYGKSFPIQIGLLVTLCYIADATLFALAIISLLAAFILVFYKNLAPIIPLLFMAVMIFKDYTIMNGIIPYAILSPAIAAFIARPFIHPIKIQKTGLLALPLVFVTLAFAFAGINKDDYDFMYGIAFFLALGPVMLVIYLLFSLNIEKRKGFCIKKYLCYSLMVTGLAMALEIAYVRYILKDTGWSELGWINVNGCAAFLLLAIPACYYLLIKSRIILPLIICLLGLYAGMLISGSDAALGISILYTPFLLLYTYRHIYRTKRKTFSYSVAIIIIAVAIAVIVLVSLYGYQGMLDLLQVDTSSSGRSPIYEKAIELFRENPIFGYGMHFRDDTVLDISSIESSIRIFNFHSTLFHVMATMGMFGLLAYGFYFLVRFFILMRKYSPFTMTMLTAFIMFESYAMVDCGEFNAIPLMSAVTVIITVAEWATKKENATTALPLTTNKRNGYYF